MTDICRIAPRTVHISLLHPVNLHPSGGLLLPRIFSGMRDMCQGVHNRLNTLRLVTIECCLSRHMCGDGHRPSQLLQSRHSEFSVSSSTRLETRTCYLQTLCLKTRTAVLPSVCLETTLDHVEIPCLKKPRDVSTMFHL